MIRGFIKKMVRVIGILLAVTAIVLGAIILRFAIYAPGTINNILRTIGG